MKNALLSISLISLCFVVSVKAQKKCGFDAIQQQAMAHSDYDEYLLEKKLSYKNFQQDKMDTVIQIPVVVHVIYRLPSENISTAQINSQIAVLNKDFRKLNADTTNSVGWSKADVKFEFILAGRDPNGKITNGITRTRTTVDNIGFNNGNYEYFDAMPAWNSNRYLNIWVCDVGDQLLGFAYAPNTPGVGPEEDGLVIGSNYFGTVGTAQSPWNLGRTATHELGHYFDLLHLWGNDFRASCNTDDGISDTPNQESEVYTFNSCSTNTSCGSLDQLSNFLQYVDDRCMGNFTAGQKARMRMALYTQRDSLQYGELLGITSISKQNIPSRAMIYPNPTSSDFTVELPQGSVLSKVEIEIFDLAGKLINHQTKQVQNGFNININTAPRGVYFVRIINDEFRSTKKLIKH